LNLLQFISRASHLFAVDRLVVNDDGHRKPLQPPATVNGALDSLVNFIVGVSGGTLVGQWCERSRRGCGHSWRLRVIGPCADNAATRQLTIARLL
jgi:hypothetical protein